MSSDVDVGSSAFVVTASDGSLAIQTNKFTVAGGTGNTVVAGTPNATGAATLSSTLDVAGNVDVNSKFAVTASDGSLAIATNMFTVAGGKRRHGGGGDPGRGGRLDVNSGMFAVTAGRSLAIRDKQFTVAGGQHGGGGDAERDGSDDAVEHAGRGGRRGRELEVCGDCIGRVSGDPMKQVHGGRRHGQHGGGGDAERDRATTLSSTLDVAGDVDVNSKFAVTHRTGLAIATLFTVAGSGDTVVAGTPGRGGRRGREQWDVCGDCIGRVSGDPDKQVHGGRRHGQHWYPGILRGGDGDSKRFTSTSAEATGTLAIGGDATFAGAVTVTGIHCFG